MKDVCLCIIKPQEEGDTPIVHSVGINSGDGKYYSQEGGGTLTLTRKLNTFEYRELDWDEFKEILNKGIVS